MTTLERAPTRVFRSSEDASRAVARQIASLIRERAAAGRTAVLGLATGSTPTSVYGHLVRMHEEDGLSFANVVTFNLDEYWPMRPNEIQSYRRFMDEHLFDLVDVPPESVHVPDGSVERSRVVEHCEAYERAIAEAGGIDFQILGIGRTGHIGFNEPGSPRDSRTRLITLDRVTRMDAASDFFGEWNVPRQAITMGVGTILAARKIVLMAFGEHKAPIVRDAVEGDVTPSIVASFLQEHGDAQFILDEAAAGELTRIKTPWLLGPLDRFGLEWDERTTKRAVVWLAGRVEKPITKLTDNDYNEHGLQELLSTEGPAYDINIRVFRGLQKTITGWPGGKRGRPLPDGSADQFPKRVVVFSPHPDDDVISMGGTLQRLCAQGHDVHVAYQTSGNIAVFDDDATRHAEFVAEYCRAFDVPGAREVAASIEGAIEEFVRNKQAGDVDSPQLKQIKTLIRRTEARAAAVFSGAREDRVHFLDMPFYETGKVKKKPLGEEDVRVVVDLLEAVRPHQVYAAGDLSDPHGTHRVCLAAITTSLHRLADAPWMRQCQVWLYRGAWQEWSPHEIEMAVPLSPDEVEKKRMAIFKHESQKDKALFPGPWDTREFWQRAEDRNRHTARLFDKLGLPEYEAIEGFVRWAPSEADGSLTNDSDLRAVVPSDRVASKEPSA